MAKILNISLDKQKKEIKIQNMNISSPEIYEFLEDKDNKEDWLVKAMIIGCVGLKQMLLKENVDFVEKEFNKFIVKTKEVFEKQAQQIDEKIDNTFNTDKKNSPISQFTNKLDSTLNLKNEDSPLFQMKALIIEYFDTKKGKFKELIDEYFNKDEGQVKQLIDETFNLDNKKSAFSKLIENIKENTDLEEEAIKDLLDPNKSDSPLKLLKEGIFEKFKDMRDTDIKQLGEKIKDLREKEIKEIRDEVLKEKAIEEEKEKGTSKGFDFQQDTYEEIQRLASVYEDKVVEVGEKRAITGKKGDIIIDLNGDSKKRIVVECKDSKYSAKKATDEILESIKNRKAAFGIFLFAKRESMPSQFCPIKITDSYIITCMEKENLYLAYRLARILLLREKAREEKIDLEKVCKELNKIEEVVKSIDNMQGKVTNILNSGDYLRENLGKLQREIELSLDKIKMQVGEVSPSSSDEDEESQLDTEETASTRQVVAKKVPSWMKDD